MPQFRSELHGALKNLFVKDPESNCGLGRDIRHCIVFYSLSQESKRARPAEKKDSAYQARAKVMSVKKG
jgi:hypothetical protein